MRAAFTLKFGLPGGEVFDLKAYQLVDESAIAIKRTTKTTPAEDVETPTATDPSPKAATETVKPQAIKGVETDKGFVEITDTELEAARMSNGEARVRGFWSPWGKTEVVAKSQPYRLVSAKVTTDSVARLVGLHDALVARAGCLVVEAASRGVQRLYLVGPGDREGLLRAVEIGYQEEVVAEVPHESEALETLREVKPTEISLDGVADIDQVPQFAPKAEIEALIEKKMEAL